MDWPILEFLQIQITAALRLAKSGRDATNGCKNAYVLRSLAIYVAIQMLPSSDIAKFIVEWGPFRSLIESRLSDEYDINSTGLDPVLSELAGWYGAAKRHLDSLDAYEIRLQDRLEFSAFAEDIRESLASARAAFIVRPVDFEICGLDASLGEHGLSKRLDAIRTELANIKEAIIALMDKRRLYLGCSWSLDPTD